MDFPKMIRLKQNFEAPSLEDISGEINTQIKNLGLKEKVKAGETAAVACSSRGIANYSTIVKSTADYILPINRVKTHTEFEYSIESGLMKMIAIGLGKRRGATIYHQVGQVLFVVSPIAKVPFEDVAKEVFVFMLVEIGVLLIVSYVPFITTFMPRLFGFIN